MTTYPLRHTEDVLDAVRDERDRQHATWGEQNHPDGTGPLAFHRDIKDVADRYRSACQCAAESRDVTYRHILLEEVWEAMAEDDPDKLEEELIQVAAVAVGWVEKIRRQREAEQVTVD